MLPTWVSFSLPVTLHSILEGEEPHVRRIASVKVTIPKH